MFSAFGYYISLPFIYGISWLPFPLLYILSDSLYVVIYLILGYRTKVVRTNLSNAFPNKTRSELRQIEKQFYRYFCDLILETIKTLTIASARIKDRVSFDDPGVFARYFNEKQSVIIVMGHFGNWEFGGVRFSQMALHQLYVIYHPLHNHYFDRLLYHMRTRHGTKLYITKHAVRGMVEDRGKVTATAFIADQTPNPESAYWTKFLNQDTPVFTGTAKISKMLNYPVIYISIQRPRRGNYAMTAEVLVEDPSRMTEDEISEVHTKRLEKDITDNPHIWLWTHRRWKHKK
ncbi:MAG: lysophospholipid acyltransferase family protein [Saprospiraceae bacterium]|nr:lysophospholipid acyltransferase family protein [Saprospiraceae bacterium]